jgi:ribonuclease Z
VPTRRRNHNALFLRWDTLGILFDPGEGTQRQLLIAGIAATQITHICITHFHGDHCLGLAALCQRISLDRVPHAIEVIYPASGQVFFERLRHASIYHDQALLVPRPIPCLPDPAADLAPDPAPDHAAHPAPDPAVRDPWAELVVSEPLGLRLSVRRLDHRVDCFGYRLQEPDGRRMLPERLAALSVRGPAVKQLQQAGTLAVPQPGGTTRTVRLDEVSEPRPGQSFALVMDTRPCEGARRLAQGVDLLVCESTFLSEHAEEAHDYHHMTAAQAATLGREAGARRLVLTHFSQRYTTLEGFRTEAGALHPDVIVAEDFTQVALPPRRES